MGIDDLGITSFLSNDEFAANMEEINEWVAARQGKLPFFAIGERVEVLDELANEEAWADCQVFGSVKSLRWDLERKIFEYLVAWCDEGSLTGIEEWRPESHFMLNI